MRGFISNSHAAGLLPIVPKWYDLAIIGRILIDV
jgi:hypothetical protein